MRLFQIDQVIFDLDKVTHAEWLSQEQELVLGFVDGLPLVLSGEAAKTFWVVLGSLACDLTFREDVPEDSQEKALDRASS